MADSGDLPPDQRRLWFKAMRAWELGNYGYVVDVVEAILKQVPEFSEGQEILRKAKARARQPRQ